MPASVGEEVGVGHYVAVANHQQAVDAEMFFRDLANHRCQRRGIDALRFRSGGSPLSGGEVNRLGAERGRERGKQENPEKCHLLCMT